VIRICRNIDVIIIHDVIFDVIAIGIGRVISTSKIRKITGIRKNRSENGNKRTPVCYFTVVCSLLNTHYKETDVWTALNHIATWLVSKPQGLVRLER
jgi:hypothetical protein